MSTKATPRVERVAVLRWIPLNQIRISLLAQRAFRQAQADRILAHLNLELIGYPTVNQREGDTDVYYAMDAQHRLGALRKFFEDDSAVKIQCQTYFGMTEPEEAAMFLDLNGITLAVPAYEMFRIGVVAVGYEEASDIDRIVRANGCVVTRDKIPGAIRAVAALRSIYGSAGGPTLGHTIRVIRDAYGDSGFETNALKGVALVLDRYGDEVDDLTIVTRLGRASLGVKGLLQRGEHYRLKTGLGKAHCVAAAVVDTYNSGRGGKNLTSWWKDAA